MDKLIQLNKGEYTIPDNCRAMVHAGKVYVFERLIRGRKKGSHKQHCKDYSHRQQGYACWAASHKTMICTQRPKYNTRGIKGLYYAADKYGTICSKFKPLCQQKQ